MYECFLDVAFFLLISIIFLPNLFFSSTTTTNDYYKLCVDEHDLKKAKEHYRFACVCEEHGFFTPLLLHLFR